MSAHSPLPWRVGRSLLTVRDANDVFLGRFHPDDAALIVEAVNERDTLRWERDEARDFLDSDEASKAAAFVLSAWFNDSEDYAHPGSLAVDDLAYDLLSVLRQALRAALATPPAGGTE